MRDLTKPRISLKFLTICHFFNATLFRYKRCSLTITFFSKHAVLQGVHIFPKYVLTMTKFPRLPAYASAF